MKITMQKQLQATKNDDILKSRKGKTGGIL
jgi:DNA-binding IscR family transcriptional regulator